MRPITLMAMLASNTFATRGKTNLKWPQRPNRGHLKPAEGTVTVLKCKEVQPNVIGTTRREKWLTEFAYPASINVRLIAIVTLKVESVVTITVVTKSISKHWLTCHASTILGAK